MSLAYKLLDKLRFIPTYFKYRIVKNEFLFPYVYTSEETVDHLLQTRKSVARFGDGEFNVMTQKTIGFQKFNSDLAAKLKEVLLDADNDYCEVMIPRSLFSMDNLNFGAKVAWQQLISEFYVNYQKDLIKDKKYYNSSFTRFYIDLKDKRNCSLYVSKLKKLWERMPLLIIEGKNSRLGVGNDLFNNAMSINRIITEDKDAFTVYNDLVAAAKEHGRAKLILIALGPTATALAYELAKDGFYAMDIGHIDIEYEWYLRRARKKVKLEGKHINELAYFQESGLSVDPMYTSQIVAQVLK